MEAGRLAVHVSGREPFFCPDDEQFAFELDLDFVHGADDVADGLEVYGAVFLVERPQHRVDGVRAGFDAVDQNVFLFDQGFVFVVGCGHRVHLHSLESIVTSYGLLMYFGLMVTASSACLA